LETARTLVDYGHCHLLLLPSACVCARIRASELQLLVCFDFDLLRPCGGNVSSSSIWNFSARNAAIFGRVWGLSQAPPTSESTTPTRVALHSRLLPLAELVSRIVSAGSPLVHLNVYHHLLSFDHCFDQSISHGCRFGSPGRRLN
ncbi:uncharacterized protein EI90DRAFT_3044770, partial [Cantharellus anzutake]|uniref:uncharacterized protein n=1 Tax=Cantharellus anzutake TaxID=1750568 RepID=UPI001907D14F